MSVQKFITLVFILTLTASCSTIFSDDDQDITINTKPEGARIYLNNERKGFSNQKINVKTWKTNIVEVRKYGYENEFINIHSTTSDYFWLNAFNLGIGGVVDYFTGYMWNIQEDSLDVNVDLLKVEKGKDAYHPGSYKRYQIFLKQENSLTAGNS